MNGKWVTFICLSNQPLKCCKLHGTITHLHNTLILCRTDAVSHWLNIGWRFLWFGIPPEETGWSTICSSSRATGALGITACLLIVRPPLFSACSNVGGNIKSKNYLCVLQKNGEFIWGLIANSNDYSTSWKGSVTKVFNTVVLII